MLRAAGCCSVVLVVMIAACSSESDSGAGPVTPGIATPTGHGLLTMDELEAALLAGVEDEPVPMTEAQLDQYFPLVARLTEPAKDPDRDPTKGDPLDAQKAFDAFTTAETADDHFTIDVTEAGVMPADMERVKKGLLYGMASWDSYKPGFSLTAASSVKAGGKPFKVTLKTTPDKDIKFRPYVLACGGSAAPTTTTPEIVAAIDAGTCVPRIVLPIEPGKVLESLSPFIFVHEMAHVAQAYWQRDPAYLAAGGLKAASAYNADLSWMLESDAQLTARHAPDGYAFDDYLGVGCPFEPLRRGAFSWDKLSARTGNELLLPYQMGIFVDQLTWHRFGKDPKWTYQWLTTKVDARSKATPPAAPISATRRLMELVSKKPATSQESFDHVLLQAGVDLYFRGRDPWTTRQLTNDCIRPAASVDLPLLAIDALRVDPGDLSTVAKLRLSLEASRDPAFLRAGVAIVELDDAGKPKFITCAQSITESNLAGTEPRSGCLQTVKGLSVLSPKNDFKDDVSLPITFTTGGKYAIIAIVAHLMKRADAPNTPIHVTLHAEPISTPPGNAIAKSQCGDLTEEYRSHCKTSNCLCIGNAYCEATVDPPPASCEKMQRDCQVFCLFQKSECDCASFCDLLYSRLACRAP